MTIHHIFYNSNKDIMWSATAGVDSTIINGQKSNNNYDYAAIDCTDTPVGEKYYMNNAGNAIVAKTAFTPSFSTTTPALDAVVTVTGVPAGTEVFLDGSSGGTMSNTTLTFTATEVGTFEITFKKDKYLNYTTTLTTKRYGE